jgi:hypothetical protein
MIIEEKKHDTTLRDAINAETRIFSILANPTCTPALRFMTL